MWNRRRRTSQTCCSQRRRTSICVIAEARKEGSTRRAAVDRLHLYQRLIVGEQDAHGIVVWLSGSSSIAGRCEIDWERNLRNHLTSNLAVIVAAPVALINPWRQRIGSCCKEKEILIIMKLSREVGLVLIEKRWREYCVGTNCRVPN